MLQTTPRQITARPWILAILLILGTGAITGDEVAQPVPAPKVGDMLPDLGTLQTLRGGPPAADVDGITGEAQLLVFWTSWCYACRESVKQLNDLQGAVGDAASIVLVVHESAEQIDPVLEELDVRAWVVRDDNGYAFERMAVRGVPMAALVGPSGRIVGLTHPGEVTAESVLAAARGEAVALPETEMQATHAFSTDWDLQALEAEGTEPQVRLVDTEVQGKFARFDRESGQIRAPGRRVRSLAADAWHTPHERIESRLGTELDRRLVEVTILPPDGSLETSRRLLRNALGDLYGVKARREMMRKDAAALVLADGKPGPTPSTARESSLTTMGPTLRGTTELSEVAAWIGGVLDRPGVDATGLGRQLYDLELDARDLETLKASLSRYGLDLRLEPQTVEMLILERAR